MQGESDLEQGKTGYRVLKQYNDYEAWAILSETELVSLQPLGADHATLPHMKAMHVPFHLVYGSLISFKGFQSDRPKSRGMSVDPR